MMSLISLVSNQDKSNSATTSLDKTEMYSIQVSIIQFLPLYLADFSFALIVSA